MEREEKAEESRPGYYEILRNDIMKRNPSNEYLIGSSTECDLRITNLAKKQVGLWGAKDGGVTIASYGRIAQIVTKSKGLERVYATKVTYDKEFDLHLVSSNGIVIVRIRG